MWAWPPGRVRTRPYENHDHGAHRPCPWQTSARKTTAFASVGRNSQPAPHANHHPTSGTLGITDFQYLQLVLARRRMQHHRLPLPRLDQGTRHRGNPADLAAQRIDLVDPDD